MNGMDFSKMEENQLRELIEIKQKVLNLNTTAYKLKKELNQLVYDNPEKVNPVFKIEESEDYIELFKLNLKNDMEIEEMKTEMELKQIAEQIIIMETALIDKIEAEDELNEVNELNEGE